MSATYTLHLAPEASIDDVEALDRAVLVRDGFAWGAFLAPMLWFFFHRHLLAGLAAALAVGALAGGLTAAGARPGTIVAAELLLHLLFGLEGATIRRALLTRSGRPVVDLVVADDAGEAARRAFARLVADARTAWEPRPAMPVAAASRPVGPILGLFPEREPRR